MRVVFGDGEVRELTGDRITVGRTDSNDWQLPHDFVSRSQAVLRKTDAGWLVIDLDSNNGTFVNDGDPIERQLLQVGDVIRFGSRAPAVTGTVEESQVEDETILGRSTIPGYAQIESRLDKVAKENQDYHKHLDRRIDGLEARITHGEDVISKAVSDFGREILDLREHDHKMDSSWRRSISALFWVACFIIMIQFTISVAGSVRRNPSLSAAITEQIEAGGLKEELIGFAIAGLVAYFTGKGTSGNASTNGVNRLGLSAPRESAGRGRASPTGSVFRGGASTATAQGPSRENPQTGAIRNQSPAPDASDL